MAPNEYIAAAEMARSRGGEEAEEEVEEEDAGSLTRKHGKHLLRPDALCDHLIEQPGACQLQGS
jgi:hypothetical protein